jgi:hypothetical protein
MLRIRGRILSVALATTLLVVPTLAQTQNQPSRANRQTGPTERAPFLVTRFGARCNGITDDTRAFQAALDAAGSGCSASRGFLSNGYQTVVVPDGARCKLDGGLVNSRSDCVGLSSYAGATLDFSRLPPGDTALTLKPLVYGAYTGNVARFENIQMIGPGGQSGTVAIASSSPATTFSQYNIHGFGHGYEVHSGSWTNHFENTSIWDCGVDLYCGKGLRDAGEQITFQAGALFNSGQAIQNDACEFNITDSSIDGLSGPAVVDGGGATRLIFDHVEYMGAVDAPLVESSKACNAYGGLTMEGGQIQFDHAKPESLARNDAGPGPCGGGGWGSYIRLNHVFLSNVPIDSKGAPVVTGSNASQIAVCHATNGAGGGAMGNVPNIGRPYEGQSQC